MVNILCSIPLIMGPRRERKNASISKVFSTLRTIVKTGQMARIWSSLAVLHVHLFQLLHFSPPRLSYSLPPQLKGTKGASFVGTYLAWALPLAGVICPQSRPFPFPLSLPYPCPLIVGSSIGSLMGPFSLTPLYRVLTICK